tara:strand:- start:186 stop:506 length:321 start_codon:yes stop_codon:yes gene_type:complete
MFLKNVDEKVRIFRTYLLQKSIENNRVMAGHKSPRRRRPFSPRQVQNAATAMGMMAYSGRNTFHSQSGQGGGTDFYAAGEEAAAAAFEAGGVNALLAFLAGFQGGQ